MLKLSVGSTDPKEVEKEVNESLDYFNKWFCSIQASSSHHPAVGLTNAERSAIKTFVGYYLGVGGHYRPEGNENA